MKKQMICAICVATIFCTPIVASAGVLTATSNLSVTLQQEIQYKVDISGAPLDLGTQKVVTRDNKIMVPLRIIAESLGFTVTWNNAIKAINVNDGVQQMDLSIGVDSYAAYSSTAIGMAKPQSFGIAPVIIGNSTYVPVEMFNLLYYGAKVVTVKDDIISITKTAYEGVQLPNPLVSYETIEDARKAVGFEFTVPAVLPDGYDKQEIIVIDNKLAEIFYTCEDATILYRTAKGSDDISGDYNVYSDVETATINNLKVTTKGTDGKISLAIWTNDATSFSLSFDKVVDVSTLTSIIESIK